MAKTVISICFFILIDIDNYHNMYFNNNNVEFTVLRVLSLEQNPEQTRRLIVVYKIHGQLYHENDRHRFIALL